MMTYQKHPVGTCPGQSSPTRVCIVVFDTSSAAGVVSAAQDQQTNREVDIFSTTDERCRTWLLTFQE